MRRLALGLAALAASAGPAFAQPGPVTTGPLVELCASLDPAASAYCRGFLTGAGQYHTAVTAPGALDPIFCLPTPSPSLDQSQSAFVAWARANPQFANDRAIDGVMRWAASAYPCPPPPAAPATNRRTGR